jgi:DNA polymerase-3 subunit gamma/tau
VFVNKFHEISFHLQSGSSLQYLYLLVMDSYKVSALRYRPQTFEEVVGQQAITQTLAHAINQNQLAQALLFCGPRGVGKTSCARILAKTINQQLNSSEESDFAFNIFELDAASNNSVEDIRQLNEQVRIPPQVGTHKVYIIDEVHMLSTAAFNAFLKTLEEPPKHVIFILATTEKHKIIPTILSRCQVYDFKRIGIEDIKGHLKSIAQSQNIPFEEDALHFIALKADGALRDALSIFDRMVSFTQNNLTASAVATNLNMLDFETYFKITDALLEKNIPEALIQLNEIVNKGFDTGQFLTGLGDHFRTLLVAKDSKTLPMMEVAVETQQKFKTQSEAFDYALLVNALEVLNDAAYNYKGSPHKRLHTEVCLMQLASIQEAEKKKAI